MKLRLPEQNAPAADATPNNPKKLKKVLSEVKRGPDQWFVSIDVSVVDPAQMVASGRLVPNGLRFDVVHDTVRDVCASKEIVGFEIDHQGLGRFHRGAARQNVR